MVANEQNIPLSKTCKEWMIHLNDNTLIPEVTIKFFRANFDSDRYKWVICFLLKT